MSEIKLLSIKRNEEASYFYGNNDATTLDSNKNEVVEVQENHKAPQISKKGKKEEERKSQKEKKQKIKESKKLEKEKKKSLKNSRKEVIGSVDTDRARTDIKTNGGVTSTHLINPGFQVGLNVDETVKNTKHESLNDHEEDGNKNEEAKEHEEASNQHVVSSKEHEGVSSGHELSMETQEDGHANLELSSEHRAHQTPAMEETITAEGAQHTEEAPPDILYQPKVNPPHLESTGGQHVEIEISDVTDLEADASDSYQMVDVQYSTQTSASQNSAATESQITAATVQQVESGVDLEGIFAASVGSEDDMDKQEKRRSVRFQEETEEIGHSEDESRDHEHASLNLGGDFSGTSDDNNIEQPQTLEPAVEIISREERSSKVESHEVDLDGIFSSAERKPSDNELVVNNNEEVPNNDEAVPKEEADGVKLNGRAKVNGNPKVNDLLGIELNDSKKQKNTATEKKDKRKRSGLMRCCFP